jgi:hypothetical protein
MTPPDGWASIGTAMAKPVDASKLREATIAECARRFEKAFGRPWEVPPSLVAVVPPAHVRDLEEEARRARAKLKHAVLEVAALAAQASSAPDTFSGAWGDWTQVSRELAELVQRPPWKGVEFAVAGPPMPAVNARTNLVNILDDYDIFNIGRRLKAREIALVSLLLGNWPKADGVGKPSDIIDRESNAIRLLLKPKEDRRAQLLPPPDDDSSE